MAFQNVTSLVAFHHHQGYVSNTRLYHYVQLLQLKTFYKYSTFCIPYNYNTFMHIQKSRSPNARVVLYHLNVVLLSFIQLTSKGKYNNDLHRKHQLLTCVVSTYNAVVS